MHLSSEHKSEEKKKKKKTGTKITNVLRFFSRDLRREIQDDSKKKNDFNTLRLLMIVRDIFLAIIRQFCGEGS